MNIRITGSGPLRGRASVPGDKSISHRAVMLGSIAGGTTAIRGFSPALDCRSTVEAMRSLGVAIDEPEPGTLVVAGSGLRGLREPENVIDVGNSGTTIRILPGILAGQNFCAILTGDASIRRRPMSRIVEPLTAMGCSILGRANGSLAPLAIRGGRLKGIEYSTPVPSAQVKSAILLAGLYAEGKTIVTESAPSRDHSERMLAAMGADMEIDGLTIGISGGRELGPIDIDVPGDISSAAYPIVAALLVEGSEIEVIGVGTNPTRSGFLDVLEAMGANIEVGDRALSGGEERSDIKVRSSALKAVSIEGEIIPRLIDEVPILAVAATQAEGETIIRGASELRVKESDRIAALAVELAKMGAVVEELTDGLIIKGPVALRGAEVDSHGDHRIAMSLAVAGLVAEGETIVKSAECIDISYPGFAETLSKLASDRGRVVASPAED